jgi:hypothetical protein
VRDLPDSIGLVLPPEWVEIGVDRRSFDERWTQMREEYRRGPNWSRTAERRLETFLARIRMMVEQERVVFCASLLAARDPADTEPVEGEGQGDPDPLMAACVVSVLLRTELGSDLALTADTVLRAYSAPDTGGDSHLVNLQPPDIVDLGTAGAAVHLVRLARIETEPAVEAKLFTETFVVPVSDGEAVCVVQMTTPNVDESTIFSELFGAIAQTLRVFYEDTPTLDPDPVA